MGYDFNIKPVGTPVATSFVRPEPAARTAVPTDLPPDKSVTASSDSSATTSTASNQSRLAADQVARAAMFDREAAQMVYVTIDKTTNIVINQYPEESKLRARAYLRSLEQAKLDNKPLDTDRSV